MYLDEDYIIIYMVVMYAIFPAGTVAAELVPGKNCRKVNAYPPSTFP